MYFQLCRKQKNKSTHILLRRNPQILTFNPLSQYIKSDQNDDKKDIFIFIILALTSAPHSVSWAALFCSSDGSWLHSSDIHWQHQELSGDNTWRWTGTGKSKDQSIEIRSTVVVYLHYIHSHASPLVCIHGFKNPWLREQCVSRHIQVKIFSPISSTFIHLWVSTHWTCSPGGRCRSGNHQSRCRSWHQQTSGWSAAAGCCSAAYLHVKKHSKIHISSVVYVKRCTSKAVALVSKSMKITVMMARCLKSELIKF